jgi:hypothetical protein
MGCSLLSIIEIFYYVVYGVVYKIARPNEISADIERPIKNDKWATKRVHRDNARIQDEKNAVLFGAINDIQRTIHEDRKNNLKDVNVNDGTQQSGMFGVVSEK